MKRLTPKEEQVMGFLWEHGPLFVREMLDFYEEPKPHFNTVSTVVHILEDEGYIGHISYGRNYQYYATLSYDDYKIRELKRVISKYFDDSYLGVIPKLLKEEEFSLEELKALVQQLENDQP